MDQEILELIRNIFIKAYLKDETISREKMLNELSISEVEFNEIIYYLENTSFIDKQQMHKDIWMWLNSKHPIAKKLLKGVQQQIYF